MTPATLPIFLQSGIKIMVLMGFFLYVLFALVLVRQEQLMANVLEEEFEPKIKMLVIVHLVASLFVFLLAMFLL